MKSGKAIGEDGVGSEELKWLEGRSQERVLDLFEWVWEDGEYPEEWRRSIVLYIAKVKGRQPVSLDEERAIRLQSRVAAAHAGTVAERERLFVGCGMERSQGARQGSGTVVTAAGLVQLTERREERGLCTFLALIDLRKCFDTVDKRVAEVALRQMGVRGKLLRAAMAKYKGRSMRIKVRSAEGWKKGKARVDETLGVAQDILQPY
jgi:hypothetical protein